MIKNLTFVVLVALALLQGCGNEDLADSTSAASTALASPTPAPSPTPPQSPASDTTPPTTPGGVRATATSSTSLTISWTAAADNVSVSGYRLFRCEGTACATFNQISSPTSSSYVDTGLTASTAYSYRVSAVDAAGNVSPQSARATGTTLAASAPPTTDTAPPTVPAGLAASATSSSAVSLGWSAASDNVGVANYRIFRCAGSGCTPTTQIGTSSSTSFLSSGLTASTAYVYSIVAVDAAGNASAPSAPASATTLAASPPAPGSGAIPTTAGWFQIPNTQLNSVCAATNGFAQVSGNTGCSAIVGAWNSGAFDTKRNRLLIWGGGHTDYYGNELYSLDLRDLTINRLNAPGLPIASGCTESIAGGTQPNSRHTYDGLEYMENVDRLFVFSGSLACGAGTGGQDTWTLDLATMRWQLMSPAGVAPKGDMGMLTAYDRNTGRVYVHDRMHLYAYDFATNTYTRISSQTASMGYTLTATIDPKRNLFLVIGYDRNASAGRVYAYDLSAAPGTAMMQTWSTSGGAGIVSDAWIGLAYHPPTDRIVAWNGDNTVYSLNPDTKQWSTVTLTGGPGPLGSHGTIGRWNYSPSSDVFVVVNRTDQNGFTFRLP